MSRHIVRLFVGNWLLLLTLVGIFALLPQIISAIYLAVTLKRAPPDEIMHVLFGNYPLIAGLSFVGAWLTLEMQGYALTPQKVGPFRERPFGENFCIAIHNHVERALSK